jgi:outer membrane immunogenic protein
MIMATNMEDRVKNLLFASVAAVALLGGSANAADLARPAPIYAPAPVLVPLFTWTGCYVGGNVGGVWAMSDWNDAILGDFGSSSATGALGGLQAGCNYQVSRWVFGIQADYDWTNANNNNPVPLFPAVTDQTQIKSLASITGRVGYTFWDPRFLGYVKAGGAWEQGNFSFQVGAIPFTSASATQSGWTVGIGGEYAFLDWLTGFIEYDYYRFGSSNPGPLACTPAVCGFAANNLGITTNVNVLKVGLNFKFRPSF